MDEEEDVVEVKEDSKEEKEVKTKEKPASLVPWIEKYRPKKLDDVAHQEEVVKTLRQTVKTGNLPHLLFYGPPGTGKTSTILAVARELYGHELMKSRVLELNASNERGIDVIREKVKQFAQVAVGKDTVKGHPCPPFKIIILDEADSMTKDAQHALRRTMESYTKVTRFCIICNYVTRIIDPITSRCAKYRFAPLPADAIRLRIKHIAQIEGVSLEKEAIEVLIKVTEGDLRKAITLMQSGNRLVEKKEVVTAQCIVDVAGLVPDDVMKSLLSACAANNFETMQKAVQEVCYSGYPAQQIITQLMPMIVTSKDLRDSAKSKISLRVAEADKKLNDGADEFLQLMDIFSFMTTCIHEKSS